MLYIIATPIGNLEDITLRAIRTLKEVDLIAAEDTRHARILLNKYEIKTPLESFHAHSDDHKLHLLIDKLKEGKTIALISDAGTPGISDPGYILIKAAIEKGIKVIPIPGPAAFLTALQASGLPTHQFLYLGFLPQKKGRQTLLESLKEEKRTIIFYESTHRILKTLSQLNELFTKWEGEAANKPPSDKHTRNDTPPAHPAPPHSPPARQIVIARELTKIHEEYFRGSAKEAYEHFNKKTKPKGEFVVMIGGVK